MKKLLLGLLAVVTIAGAVHARTFSDKTFLMPRSHNENLAMEYTTWHKQIRAIDEDKWGGALQITGFYQESENKTGLGKYFGAYNPVAVSTSNPSGLSIMDFIGVQDLQNPVPPASEKAILLNANWILHDYSDSAVSKLSVKGQLRPHQESYGLRLDYNQKLDKLAKGLYFKVTAPIVHVENNMDVSYSGSKLSQVLPGTTRTVSLADYLAGRVENTTAKYIQKRLTKAVIDGDDSTTGVADVDVTLGYNFVYSERRHVGVNVCLTIPTSDTASGDRLFEAKLGFGGHWALGLGVDGAFELWKDYNKSLEFLFAANYKYLLNETEVRTLDFKYSNSLTDDNSVAGKRVPYGRYFLGGKVGENYVFPLANVLTREVSVDPGSQLEVLASFVFNYKYWTFDLGYNLFAKEKESVEVKTWADDTYAIAKRTYDTDNAFAAQYVFDGSSTGQCFIQKEHLLTDAASNPVYVTHKIFGGVGYAFNDWKYPVMFGLGGSWEFVQGSNAALDAWALWLKAGVSF